MQGVPAGTALAEQVHAGQPGQQRAGPVRRDPGQAGRGADGHVRARVQAEQPEHPRRVRGQRAVGPGEHRPDIGGRVIAPERVERVACLAQVGGEHGEGKPGAGGGAGRGDGQRQRQARAAGDDLVDRVRFAAGPAGAHPAGHQLARPLPGEQVQVQRVRTMPGDQAGEVVSAGHDGQAAGRAGQQRAYLPGVARVVEDHEHPPAGQQAAVQRHLVIQADRDPLRRHGERLKEAAQRLTRIEGGPGRVEPAQVDIQLPAGKPRGDPVRPVHRQGRLAHPGGAGDHRDGHAGGVLGLLAVQDLVQAAQLRVAAGERRHRRRQLRGDRHRRRCGRSQAHRRGAGIQRRVLPQDSGLELAQRRTGRQPEFVGQDGSQSLVHGQRVGLPPAAVERRHQLGVDLLVERVVRGHLLELGYQLPVLPGVQPGLGQRVPDLLAKQVQPVRLLLQPGQPGQVGQRPAAP